MKRSREGKYNSKKKQKGVAVCLRAVSRTSVNQTPSYADAALANPRTAIAQNLIVADLLSHNTSSSCVRVDETARRESCEGMQRYLLLTHPVEDF